MNNMHNKTRLAATLFAVFCPSLLAATTNIIEPPMVDVPAGEFRMGGGKPYMSNEAEDPEALPIHSVRVPAFKMGKYEVTVKEFRQFVQATGYKVPDQCRHEPGPRWFPGATAGTYDRNALTDNDFQPAVCIGWPAAMAYAKWLSAETGKNYRLASEAEWEYAARAGSVSVYPLGEDVNKVCTNANISDRTAEFAALSRFGASYHGFMGGIAACDDGAGFASVVGLYQPNAWGLYDMIGNVAEWTQDCWNETHQNAPGDGSARLSVACDKRVLRGGSWHWRNISASSRGGMPVDFIGSIEGFRLALSPDSAVDAEPAPSSIAFERELKAAQDAERSKRQQRLAFPAAPQGLTLSAASGNGLHLSWKANQEVGITGYHVYRSEALNGVMTRIASDMKGLSFIDQTAPARKHSYAVVAVNRDVFSGFSEQVHSPDTTLALPGRIEAEDFNQTAGATVGTIQPNEDTAEPASGLNLTGPTGITKGSWTEYRIKVPRVGSYRLQLRYAGQRDSQGLALQLNGKPLATQALVSTGGYRNWKTLDSSVLQLPAGEHLLRMEALDDGWKLNWLRLY